MVRFRDLPKLPSTRFRWDNMARIAGAPTTHRDTAKGSIVVPKGWNLLGWSDKVDAKLMHGREGQLALLLECPRYGEVWHHYPLFDEEDRDEAVFEEGTW